MGNVPFRIVTLQTDATGTLVEVHGHLDSQAAELLLRVVDHVNVVCGRRAIIDFRHVSQIDEQAIEIAFGELQRRGVHGNPSWHRT